MRKNGKPITIRDVAQRSGFSPSTVSIVLNNAPLSRYILDTTKKTIEQAAQDLGYRPNFHARSLRMRKQHTIGLMVFDIADPYCTPILRGVEDSLHQAGYLSIITDVHNERVRFERCLEMLLDRHVEGIIIVANWLFVNIDMLADLARQRVPAVLIGRKLAGHTVSSVTIDNQSGAYAAIEHLYALGHRHIAFIRGPQDLQDTQERWTGIEAFAAQSGIAIDPELVVDLPPAIDFRSGFENGRRLTQQLLNHAHKFTALQAFDDITALGALRTLSRAGIRVPSQCSVTGFDDVAHAAMMTPSLTTVHQPLEKMGATAVSVILESIESYEEGNTASTFHQVLTPELVLRDSTAVAREF